jgi:hypothetical protein
MSRITEATPPVIFGLRYLEEEAAEVHDVVGCTTVLGNSATGCDDSDSGTEDIGSTGSGEQIP